jgi:LmbE family N-acetylglucosaminyl deacetylase
MIDLAKTQKVLCFFAHPDDETLSAGATISKLTRLGSEIHVAIPATGIHSRRNIQDDTSRESDLKVLKSSCQEALRVLGISPERINLGEFSDNEMDKHSLLELIHWLENILRKVNPDLILTHHRYCTNIDHQYCHEAVVVATRPSVTSHIPVLCGEVPSATGYLRPAAWEPNYYIEVSEEDIDKKCRAMETYIGEARPDPHPRSREVLKALAKVRGSESGFLFAESFMIQKAFG